MRLLLPGIALVTLLSACAARSEVRVESEIDGASVTAWLYTANEAADKSDTLVHGRIEIRAQKPIVSAKLDCIGLAAETVGSKQIYVDSVASVLTDTYPARDGMVAAKVYWLIPKIRPDDLDLSQLRLSINQKNSNHECVKY